MFEPDVMTSSRRTALGAMMLAILALALSACSQPPEPLSVDEVTRRISSEAEGGSLYAQPIFVKYADGRHEEQTLFVVVKADGSKVVYDKTGQRYAPSLDDFRKNNHLFTPDDKITLPRDFPATNRSGDVDLITVSGHTATAWEWWWLIGGAAALLIIGGVIGLWVRARRPRADDSTRT